MTQAEWFVCAMLVGAMVLVAVRPWFIPRRERPIWGPSPLRGAYASWRLMQVAKGMSVERGDLVVRHDDGTVGPAEGSWLDVKPGAPLFPGAALMVDEFTGQLVPHQGDAHVAVVVPWSGTAPPDPTQPAQVRLSDGRVRRLCRVCRIVIDNGEWVVDGVRGYCSETCGLSGVDAP